jgi:hypothetical protein
MQEDVSAVAPGKHWVLVLPGMHLSRLHLLHMVGVERYVFLGHISHDVVDVLK